MFTNLSLLFAALDVFVLEFSLSRSFAPNFLKSLITSSCFFLWSCLLSRPLPPSAPNNLIFVSWLCLYPLHSFTFSHIPNMEFYILLLVLFQSANILVNYVAFSSKSMLLESCYFTPLQYQLKCLQETYHM